MPEVQPPLHHLRAHRRNPLHGDQEGWAARAFRAPEDFARAAKGVRKEAGSDAETRSNRRRSRRRGAGSHGARTHYHRDRRNDHAPAEEAGQSRVREVCVGLYGFQGCTGVYVGAEEPPERSHEEVKQRNTEVKRSKEVMRYRKEMANNARLSPMGQSAEL